MLFVSSAYAMTLEQSVETALKNNPDLQAARLETAAAEGRLEQARLLLSSNPAIEGSLSNKDTQPDGGEKVRNYGLKLSQEIELAGQRGIRIDAAKNGQEKVIQETRDKERVLVAEVKDAFATALALKRKKELTREAVQLQESLAGSASVKFQAGEISSLELNLADVELGKSRRDLLLAEREQREALNRLQLLLGLKLDAGFTAEGNLPTDVAPVPDRERVLTAAQRPDVQAALAELQATKAAMKLAGREAFPSVTVSGFYSRDDRLDEVGVMLSFPIPLFDRKQADRKEAAAKAGQALIKQTSRERSVEREIVEAHANLASATEELALFKKDILGKALENLGLMNLAYQEGKIGFFEVRIAQRDTIEAHFAYVESQLRLQLAINALEKTTGGSLK
jgi:cobalt-zinc-cadmium efflux system outer membrane protein